MRHAAASASSATPVECSRSHGDLRSVNAAIAMNAASTLSPAIPIWGNGSPPSPAPTSAYRPARRAARRSCPAEFGEPGLVGRARSTRDDGARFVGPGAERKTEMSLATCRSRIGNGIASPRRARESPSVPAREDVLERRLDARAEAQPAGEALRHLTVHRERMTSDREAVLDGLLDHRGAELGGATEADVRPEERKHFCGVAQVDERERGARHDVVAVELRGLVPVRRAPRGVKERDVEGVDELLRRRSGELAQANREHRAAHRMLERLSGAEVGRERQGADDLGGANRPRARGEPGCLLPEVPLLHVATLYQERLTDACGDDRAAGTVRRV